MSQYYNRDGEPMTLFQWMASFEDTAGRRVAETTLEDGTWISTVWLGLDHSFGSGPPLIFETMVFARGSEGDERDSDRYSSEEEALRGHAAMVERWRPSTVDTSAT